ncbi:TrmH family RNA methyltransferase [Anaerophaga thermohalophila]|uniref:TrmH family RNA methyltransferase n=1 Tax=Anaerophaga thermohalophila TaxID=177400 RepID=UPI000302E84B|nr:RNA methyltransferase [Anaerophaga thermohalophila]
MEKELIKYLSQFITPERLHLFENILSLRTNYLTVVLENIFHPHNASAVLRSCDCFGIQDVHIIEDRNRYEVNPDIALGASKWLSLHKYTSASKSVLSELKKRNFRIFAAVPDTGAVMFTRMDIRQGPFALVFGSEKNGISGDVKEMADGYLTIPMVGFTKSLNISVAAAIMLQHFTFFIRTNIDKSAWQLEQKYHEQLLLDWMRKTIKRVDLIEETFWKNQRLK